MIRANFCQAENVLAELLTAEKPISMRSADFYEPWLRGHFSDSQSKAILTLLAHRGEQPEALIQLWHAIRKIENTAVPFSGQALDTCGTGGDGSDSLNLSTLSAVVMAAAGVTVIKHGNRAITSRCGSSDLLASFGMRLDAAPSKIIRSAETIGMGYFHAPAVHPVYARFQPIRKSIKIRTAFNLLGPVLNPVAVTSQLLGISKKPLLEIYANLLPRIGRKTALIYQGPEGMDEITTTGVSTGIYLCGNKIQRWTLRPAELQFKKGRKSELKVSSIQHAHRKTVEIFRYRQAGTARDSVLLNAACGIWVSAKAKSIAEGLKHARQALDSGHAWKVLNQLVKNSKS